MYWHEAAPQDSEYFEPAAVFEAGLKLHHISNTAYPIGHVTTMRPYRIGRSQVQGLIPQAWTDIDELGLYVHIPFCDRRCGFCEYTVTSPEDRLEGEERYFESLLQEFMLYQDTIGTKAKRLVGFDIGGGTPSIARTEDIERVVSAARRFFTLPERITISIETTPKIAALEPQKMAAYYQMGIYRISMGVQTINPRLLAAVGRTATSLSYNLKAVENIRKAGFGRFNIDVMYGFANQTLTSLEATLAHVIGLAPEYVTLYRTRYKGTSLAGQGARVSLDAVNRQASLAKDMLLAAGYAGSAGKNTFSRLTGDVGTSDYLTERVIHGTPYLGLGLGAQSLSQTTLAYNTGAADKRLQNYCRQVQAGTLPVQDLYHLSIEAAMGKMISVSFYFGEINLDSFENKFRISLAEAFPNEIRFVFEQDLMETITTGGTPTTRTLRLTSKGERNINGVIALFYASGVKSHLLNLAQTGQTGLHGSIPVRTARTAQIHI